MREIKFRAWEKTLKEMIPVSNINFEPRLINVGGAWRFFDDIELMQYTGLKDKNRVKIFENDIVNFVNLDGIEFIGIIKFQNGIYKILNSKVSSNEFILNHIYLQDIELEIIGNIFENPELLRKQYIKGEC